MKSKFLVTMIALAGLFYSPVFAQNEVVQRFTEYGIDLEFIPNDNSHTTYFDGEKNATTTTKRWDPRIKIYRDKSFNQFFHTRTIGWNGGDGFYSTLLPDGNTFWSIADSFFGTLKANRVRGGNENNFPRNGAIIQTGFTPNDFYCVNELVNTTNPSSSNYYKGKTWLRHPAATKTTSQINNGEVDSDIFYWSGDATVYHDPVLNTDTLQVLWGAIKNDMSRTETALSEYVINGTPASPGAGGYLKLVNYVRLFRPFTNTYGSGIWEDYVADGGDGHTYYYGSYKMFPVVARSLTHDVKSPWEYWLNIGGTWSWQRRDASGPTDTEMTNSRISDHWMTNLNIIKHNGKYYFISQEEAQGPEVYIWEGANTPYGNVDGGGKYSKISSNRKIIYLTEAIAPLDRRDKTKLVTKCPTYNSFISPQFSKEGELILSFNANPENFWDNFDMKGSADLYQPYFVRIFNWDKVFDPMPVLNVKSISVKDICGTANSGGKISPSDPFTRNAGSSVTFTITPNAGYEVAEFNVYSDAYQTNGVSKASIISNRWTLPTTYGYGDYTIEVIFRPIGVLDCPTAIKNIENENCIVYPNPTEGKIFVSNLKSPTAVSVYDNMGRLLQTVNTENEVDVSAYPTGLYFVKVHNQFVKVIKK